MVNTDLAAGYFICPLTLFYVKFVTISGWRIQKKDLWHLLIPTLVLFACIPYFLKAPAEKTLRLTKLEQGFDLFSYEALLMLQIVYIFPYYMLAIYAVFNQYNIRNFFRDLRNDKAYRLVFSASFLVFTMLAFILTAFFTNNPLYFRFSSGLLAAVGILYFLLGHRYQMIFEKLLIKFSKEKYPISVLNNLDLDTLKNRLEHLLNVKKVYRDEDLSLNMLAKKLDVSSRQLSQYLNGIIKKPFSYLIQEYRIKEACDLLIENRDESVLMIAYSVGFNSKSSFNKVFRDVTATTPSEFRKKHEEKAKFLVS